jgi:hypothetical protein
MARLMQLKSNQGRNVLPLRPVFREQLLLEEVAHDRHG